MISQFLSTFYRTGHSKTRYALAESSISIPLTYYSKCSKKRQRFAPGQSEAVVRVPILKDSAWHTCEDCPLECQSLGVSIRGPSMPHRHIKIIEYHSITWHAIICLYTSAYFSYAVPLYISSHYCYEHSRPSWVVLMSCRSLPSS